MDSELFLGTVKELTKNLYAKSMCNMVNLYKPYALTPQQVSLLLLLRNNNNVKVSDLGNILNTPHSNVSCICNRLEKYDFITRERDISDRRVVYIKPTIKSENLFEKLEAGRNDVFKILPTFISNEEMITTIKVLEKLNEALDKVAESQYNKD